jgi:UDP-2-acetamido-2-deoxy-ribo-hexuluronate aminotransferase
VIEDAAQSFGATYKNKTSCGLTTIACTSFFPSKPLGCYGDGGACFTQDQDLATKMEQIRVHGQAKRYYHTRLGITGRIDTMQAAFLLEKLEIFPEEIQLRQQVAKRYQQLLPDNIKKPFIESHNTSVYAQYTLETHDRERVLQELQAKGIPTAVHYPLGLHQQPIFKTMYPREQKFPHAEFAASHVFSIPMHPYLSLADQQKIANALDEVVNCEKEVI